MAAILQSMLWSIDTCQNKVSPDQYHVTISQLKFRAHQGHILFFQLTADQVLVFNWIIALYQVNLLAGSFGSRLTLSQDYKS